MLKCTWLILFKTKNLLLSFYVWWELENLTSCFSSIIFWLFIIMLATHLLYYVTIMNFNIITLAIYIWYNMFKICSQSTKFIKNTSVNKNLLISWKQSITFKSKNYNKTWIKLLQQILQKSKNHIKMQGFFFFFIKCMQSMTMTLFRRCVCATLHVIWSKSLLYIFSLINHIDSLRIQALSLKFSQSYLCFSLFLRTLCILLFRF